MAGCGVVNKTLTMDSTDQRAVAASAVCDFAFICDPNNAANITLTVRGEVSTLFPGCTRSYQGVDLYEFVFNGTDPDTVTILGQTAPVRH